MACSAIQSNASDTLNCSYLADALDVHIGASNCSDDSDVVGVVLARQHEINCIPNPDYEKALTIVVILVVSLIGNIGTIAILSKFKIHKVPDILVIGLALTDLLATTVPIPMSMISYFRGLNYLEDTIECDLFGVLAHFTRYSSIGIVSLVSLERYFAVNRPFVYRKYATPKKFAVILLFCWLAAFVMAVIPALDSRFTISQHQGYCLFDMASHYAILVLAFAAINYVIVFVCFVLVTVNLLRVYRRRKKLKVQSQYNQHSRAGHRDPMLTFTKANLTSRISDLGKSLKKAAPVIQEKFQLGVEAQFAGMLFAVVALFYASWTTLMILVIIAQIQRTQEGLETALFWGIRFTIISTAINPFLYGILARQYRLAYWYVIKLVLSKCCPCCINPPLKDVFAAARNIGGDARRASAVQRNKYGAQQSDYGSDYWSKNSQGVLLTHTTQTLLNPVSYQPGTNHLQIIPEDFSNEHTSVAAEFSTHVATAGELSSSVTIPQQARDTRDYQHLDHKIRGASSMHDLLDAGMMELGNTSNPMSGAENPLAMITNVVNGVEVIVSPENSDLGSDANSPPLFSNPLYNIADGVQTDKTRESMEKDVLKRQQMLLAASSTDDITLISKKKTSQSQTKSSDISIEILPEYTAQRASSPFLKRLGSNRFSLGATPPTHPSRSRKAGKGEGEKVAPNRAVSLHKSSPLAVRATDIDSGMSMMVPRVTHETSTAGQDPGKDKGKLEEVVVQPSTNRRPVTIVHTANTSTVEERCAAISPEAVDSLRQKRGSFPSVGNMEMKLLKEKLEKGGSTASGEEKQQKIQQDNSRQVKTGIKRRNSTENSDSGRESMLDSADNVVPEPPSAF